MALTIQINESVQAPCGKWNVSGRVLDGANGVENASISIAGALTAGTLTTEGGWWGVELVPVNEIGVFTVSAQIQPSGDDGFETGSTSNVDPTISVSAELVNPVYDQLTGLYSGRVRFYGSITDECPECCIIAISLGGDVVSWPDVNGDSTFESFWEFTRPVNPQTGTDIMAFDARVTDPFGRQGIGGCTTMFTAPMGGGSGGQ